MVGFLHYRVWRAMNLCGIFHGLQLQSGGQENLSGPCEWIIQLHPIPSQKAACFLNIDLSSQPTEVWKRLLTWAAETPEAPRQSPSEEEKQQEYFTWKAFFQSSYRLPKLMGEFTFTSHLSFELPLEEGRQEKGKHYKPVYLAGAAPLSLDNNNSRQPQLASAYALAVALSISPGLSKFPCITLNPHSVLQKRKWRLPEVSVRATQQ